MPEGSNSPDAGQRGGCLPLLGLFFALGGVALAIYTWRLPHGAGDIVFRATMSAVITGVGIVLIVLGRRNERTERTARSLAERHPDRPWLWREDWEHGFARPESTYQAATSMAIGVLLLLLSAPLALQLSTELVKRRNYLALLALVFPVAGLLMVGQSALAWLRQRKFANLRLTLVSIPAVLGGRLAARMEGQFHLPPGSEVSLVLSCVRSYISGSGTDRPRWQQVLWQDKKIATALVGGPGMTTVPVEFAIPYDARETDSQNPDDEIFWRLSASADLPGLDFRCAFLTPVFKTATSNPRLTILTLETESRARHSAVRPSDSQIASAPAATGGVRFYLPPARHKGMAAALTVFGALSMGSGLFFGYGFWKGLSWVVGLIPVTIFGGLGLLLLMISFGLWFGATTVEVINRELHIRSTYLVFSHSRILRKDEIQDFELHCGMQRGDEVWYDLRVRLVNGRRQTVAGGMEKSEAEWFLAQIKKDMGM